MPRSAVAPRPTSDVLQGNFPAGRLDGHPHGAPPEAQIRRVSPAVPLKTSTGVGRGREIIFFAGTPLRAGAPRRRDESRRSSARRRRPPRRRKLLARAPVAKLHKPSGSRACQPVSAAAYPGEPNRPQEPTGRPAASSGRQAKGQPQRRRASSPTTGDKETAARRSGETNSPSWIHSPRVKALKEHRTARRPRERAGRWPPSRRPYDRRARRTSRGNQIKN